MRNHKARASLEILWVLLVIPSVGLSTNYYVKAGGRNSNTGRSDAQAWQTLGKINSSQFGFGDTILFKRGNTFVGNMDFPSSGSSGKPIVLTAYGSGPLPVIDEDRGLADETIRCGQNYVVFENLHVITAKRGPVDGRCFHIPSGSRVTIQNCTLTSDLAPSGREGVGPRGIVLENVALAVVRNNDISGMLEPIIWQSGVRGTSADTSICELNAVHDGFRSGYVEGDGIRILTGGYDYRLIIRKNTVTKWDQDGIDCFGASKVIVQENTIYSPYADAIRGSGIKMGGNGYGYISRKNVFRYNRIYDLNSSASTASNLGLESSGGGDDSIYYNIVYRAKAAGLYLGNEKNHGDVHAVMNNVFISNGGYGIWVDTGLKSVYLINNVISGARADLAVEKGSLVVAMNNLVSHGTRAGDGALSQTNERTGGALFVDSARGDFALLPMSQCRNNGSSFSALTRDFAGTNVPQEGVLDIGAVEFTPSIASTPRLASPQNGSSNQPVTLSLTWNALLGAKAYRLQLSTDLSFGTTVVDDSTLMGTSRKLSFLMNAKTYYWRVAAKCGGSWSGYSAIWNLTTITSIPLVPTLLYPPNNGIVQPPSVTVRWSSSSGAQSYHLQLSTDSKFAARIVDDSTVTGTSYQLPSLLITTKYFWRVHARNVAGSSAFSEISKFMTSVAARAVPSPPSPRK